MKAKGQYLHVMLPPELTETKGGIQIAHSSQQRYFYGLVTSIGELAFDRHIEAGINDAPLAEGDIIAFDQMGIMQFELSSMEQRQLNDLHRIAIIRYGTVTTLLSDREVEDLDLYDFREERISLKKGRGGRVETMHAS